MERYTSVTAKPCWPSLKGLFHTLHRRAELSQKAFARALATVEAKVWEAALEPVLHPRRYPHGQVHRLIENLVDRFCQHGEGYFRFITSPEIQPPHNSVEQALRFVVMDRPMTQGARSQRGPRFLRKNLDRHRHLRFTEALRL